MLKKLYIVLAVVGYMQLGQAAAGPIITTYVINTDNPHFPFIMVTKYVINTDIMKPTFEKMYANLIKKIAPPKTWLENIHANLIKNVTELHGGTTKDDLQKKFYIPAQEALGGIVDIAIKDILNRTDLSQTITPYNSDTFADLKKKLSTQLKERIMQEYYDLFR